RTLDAERTPVRCATHWVEFSFPAISRGRCKKLKKLIYFFPCAAFCAPSPCAPSPCAARGPQARAALPSLHLRLSVAAASTTGSAFTLLHDCVNIVRPLAWRKAWGGFNRALGPGVARTRQSPGEAEQRKDGKASCECAPDRRCKDRGGAAAPALWRSA